MFIAWILVVFVLILPQCNAWSLTNDQRRAFLRYYAPLVFKRAEEEPGKRGYDWITNFDFDTDKIFSNNKDNWEHLDRYILGTDYSDWTIRPTLYTAILEYMSSDGANKGATLLYHIYHAKQDKSIHDWERVEVKVSGIRGNPGSGELVRYVTVTEHHDHKQRLMGHEDLNFMPTSYGRHPMVWQAEQARPGSLGGIFGSKGFYGGEVHFVENSWTRIKEDNEENNKAEVDVNGDDEKNFHYLFVPQDDPQAVSYWGAQTLTYSNAFDLHHGQGVGGISFRSAKKIKYELRNLADIFPTHWSGGFYSRHWTTETSRRILLESPLAGGIDGGPSVPAGLQTFYARSKDDEDKDEHRNGYPTKSWLWGVYRSTSESSSLVNGSFGDPARAVANGDPKSIEDGYWRQHDFYVHSGRSARWLPKGWHLSSQGGFDGRWVRLF